MTNDSIPFLGDNLNTFKRKMWVKFIILIAIFVFSYFDALSSLVNTWSTRNDYSHGFLVPFISLYFIWLERKKLKHLPVHPQIIGGIIVMLTGSFLFIIASVSGVLMLQQVSIIVIIPGIVLTVLGTQYLIALILPLSYLILMVPVLDVFDQVQWPFQIVTSVISSILLNSLGIPTSRNVQFLEIPNVVLEVAPECSGMSYLTSIIAIGIPLAYFTLRKMWQRVTLIVIAIIIGILANGLRVTLIGIWTYYGGKDVHGPLHVFQGLFVSIVGFLFLFIFALLLNKISYFNSEGHPGKKSISMVRRNSPCDVVDVKQFNRAWIVAVVTLLSVGVYFYLYHVEPIPLNNPLKELHLEVQDWKEENERSYYKKPFTLQGVDSEIIKNYRNLSGREITVYVGYYEIQRQEKELIQDGLRRIYRNAKEYEIPVNNNRSILVNKAIFNDGSQDLLAMFWYNLNGRTVASRYRSKYFTAVDGFIRRRTNGAMIIVFTSLKNQDEIEAALKDEAEFVRNTFPLLNSFLSL